MKVYPRYAGSARGRGAADFKRLSDALDQAASRETALAPFDLSGRPRALWGATPGALEVDGYEGP
jgi:hypothetical protein